MPEYFNKYLVTIYMKSGNQIVLKNVKKFSIEKTNSQVNSISWEFHGHETKILNINCDQVEAIISQRKLRLFWCAKETK